VVCGQVVDVVGDDIAGSDPVELVYACKAVVYDGCLSTLLSLECVCRGGGCEVQVATGFKSCIHNYVSQVFEHSQK
jgi:hypothetical protein